MANDYSKKLLDGEHLGYLISKIKALVGTKIDNPSTKSNGQFLKYNGTTWVAADVPDTGVLSVDKATGETVVVVDNTDPANPKIGLTVASTQGNVTLTKEADGIKANVADNALTIGKTNGLQAALDAKQDEITSDAKLSADLIEDGTTNKAYTATEKNKLAGIAEGAEVNVNADWNAASGDAQILNKPTLGTAAGKDYISTVTENSVDLVTSGAVFDVVKDLSSLHFEIVSTLPVTGQSNIIYLVLKTTTETGNIYSEYIWINNAYEKLGDTQLTLEYLTNAEIDTLWNAN